MVEAWPKKRIGDILDFKNGLNKGKAFFGHGTPIVNYMDVYHHSGLSASDINGKVSLSPLEISRYEVKKNDVFFTRTSETPEEVGIASVLLDDIKDCVFSGFVLRGRPKNNCLSPNYCKYCFSTKAVRDEIIRHCTYTTRALTNGKQLSAIEIPVPSLPEQKAIAEAITAFDTHIENLSALIEKKRAIRDGALEDLTNGRMILNGFCGKWIEKPLSQIALYRTERAATKRRFYVSTENMRQNFLGIVPYHDMTAAYGMAFDVGNILLGNIRPYLKKIWFADFSGSCSADVLVIRALENCVPQFLYYLLANDKFISYIMAGGVKGIKMPRGDKEYIMKYSVLLPDNTDDQKAIASGLYAMDEEISALEAERDKYAQLWEGVMDDLLTGRVRLNV